MCSLPRSERSVQVIEPMTQAKLSVIFNAGSLSVAQGIRQWLGDKWETPQWLQTLKLPPQLIPILICQLCVFPSQRGNISVFSSTLNEHGVYQFRSLSVLYLQISCSLIYSFQSHSYLLTDTECTCHLSSLTSVNILLLLLSILLAIQSFHIMTTKESPRSYIQSFSLFCKIFKIN